MFLQVMPRAGDKWLFRNGETGETQEWALNEKGHLQRPGRQRCRAGKRKQERDEYHHQHHKRGGGGDGSDQCPPFH